MKREELGASGVGRGFAFPHSKSDLVDQWSGGWFTLEPPLDWGSLDGQPVVLICCFFSAHDRPGDHLRELDAIGRTVKDTLVAAMCRCATAEEMQRVLCPDPGEG